MNNNYLLENKAACDIYNSVRNMPIVDYHCHLSPKMIYEDKPFDNIGEIWLGGDHYKWRLMRTVGIDENEITGNTSWHDKFIKYASALEFAAGNPLYYWSHMELSVYFGIDTPLKSSTAEDIWNRANAFIKENKLSPRKLIEQSRVEIICTTDDIIDTLEYHERIRKDSGFKTRVIPSFRTDNLLLVRRPDYIKYLEGLSAISGVKICCFADFKKAVENRLNSFVEQGCKVTDVGLVYFPDSVASEDEACATFNKVLSGGKISDTEYNAFLGNMYLYLAKLYKERNLIMQWHLASDRNINTVLYNRLGLDCGVDCDGDTVSGKSLHKMLDAINLRCGLPQTIIYTLNPANAEQIATIAGAFPNVRCGAAWWFCDHKRGIEEEINIIAENSSLGSFLGMLTDSRSFLSYARHDYFRRILCSMIGEWVEKGEYDFENADELAKKICYNNIKNLIG